MTQECLSRQSDRLPRRRSWRTNGSLRKGPPLSRLLERRSALPAAMLLLTPGGRFDRNPCPASGQTWALPWNRPFGTANSRGVPRARTSSEGSHANAGPPDGIRSRQRGLGLSASLPMLRANCCAISCVQMRHRLRRESCFRLEEYDRMLLREVVELGQTGIRRAMDVDRVCIQTELAAVRCQRLDRVEKNDDRTG